MRHSQKIASLSTGDLLILQVFEILTPAFSSKYMRALKLRPTPILAAMPGPWGKAIEALRVAKRLTRETVAKRAKMTATTYGRIERGRHTQTRKLQSIADVFGVSIDEVLQSRSLPNDAFTGNTGASHSTQGFHGQTRPLHEDHSAEMRELKGQVAVLQQELAKISADAEAARRRRRQRVSATSARKQRRSQNARKPR